MAGKKTKSSKSLKVGDQNDASVYWHWHWWSEEEAGREDDEVRFSILCLDVGRICKQEDVSHSRYGNEENKWTC